MWTARVLYILPLLLFVAPTWARAQGLDSTAAGAAGSRPISPADSTSAASGAAVGADFWTGSRRTAALPITSIELDPNRMLGGVAGSFVYDLGATGWPHGWSPDGLDPAVVELTALGVPWNDPASGRPRLDLLPAAFFQLPRVGPGVYGGSVGVEAGLRGYASPRPATELRYDRGAANLQAVAATHAQQRRTRLLGRETGFHVVGGYAGRAAAGEYAGSRLRRERHVLGRITLSRPRGHLEILNLHNRHRVGAHGGVLPRAGLGFDSVYDRFGARVTNESATRRTVRNDLVASGEVRPLGFPARFFGSGFWTAETSQFRDPVDTLTTDSDRLGASLGAALPAGDFDPHVTFTIFRERYHLSWLDSTIERTRIHVALADTATVGAVEMIARLGIHREEEAHAAASAGLRYERRGFSAHAYASRGGAPTALIHEFGYGSRVTTERDPVAQRLSSVRGGVRYRIGFLSVGLTGFFHRQSRMIELVPLDGDSAVVAQRTGPTESVGITGLVGLRSDADRGFYAEGDLTHVRRPGTAPDADGGALPSVFGRARAGVRYVLFQGDLDTHLYVEGRAWSSFQSRTFHAPTGLLIRSRPDAPRLGPSSTVGLYLEAGIREATVFLAWENLLAGTELMAGTMIVPVYPLQEQAFRFGVFWPIAD